MCQDRYYPEPFCVIAKIGVAIKKAALSSLTLLCDLLTWPVLCRDPCVITKKCAVTDIIPNPFVSLLKLALLKKSALHVLSLTLLCNLLPWPVLCRDPGQIYYVFRRHYSTCAVTDIILNPFVSLLKNEQAALLSLTLFVWSFAVTLDRYYP